MPGAAFSYTPKTLAEIRAWARGRRAPDWIARQLGCSLSTLLGICAEHGIAIRTVAPTIVPDQGDGHPSSLPAAGFDARLDPVRRRLRADLRSFAFDISRETVAEFEREAARRGTSAAILAAVCLEYLAGDGLFAAIIDR